MYIPSAFSVTDQETICEFIENFPFATLVSATDQVPAVSHLPLFLDAAPTPDSSDSTPAERALLLLGHFARENSHNHVIDGAQVLAIFHGPHSYISPAWYAADNVVPTWNYQAVHAYGKLELIDAPDAKLELIDRTVDQFEASRVAGSAEQPWSLEKPDPKFIEGLLGGIVGFRIRVERLEAKWKLSQNHSVERREKVVEALEQRGDAQSLDMAEAMRKVMSSS